MIGWKQPQKVSHWQKNPNMFLIETKSKNCMIYELLIEKVVPIGWQIITWTLYMLKSFR